MFLYGRLYTNYSEVISDVDTYTSNLLEDSVVSNADEVVLPDSGETAEDIARASWINKKGIILGGGLLIIHPDKYLINSGFLSYSLTYGSNHKKLSSYAQGKSIVHIHSNDLKKLYIFYPSQFNEQSKIFNILNYLENLITLQQRKLEQLKQLKTVMLQQLFVDKNNKQPNLRFKNFDGAWEQCRFSKLIDVKKEKNKKDLDYESYSISNIYGFIPQNKQFGEGNTYSKARKEANYIVEPHSFAYNPARINVGSIGYQNLKKPVLVSSLYEIFKTKRNINDHFLWYWFQTRMFTNQIKKYQEGGVRQYFFIDKLQISKIKIPSLNEQTIVANLFESLSKLLSLQQNKLTQLTTLKKYFLQNLFI